MNILERMAASGSEERIASFRAMQQRDYDFKVAHAEETAYKFLEHPQINGMAYVAVGGLDSITLLCFLRSIGIDLPAVSVSVLEDKSIQRVHKELGVTAALQGQRDQGARLACLVKGDCRKDQSAAASVREECHRPPCYYHGRNRRVWRLPEEYAHEAFAEMA